MNDHTSLSRGLKKLADHVDDATETRVIHHALAAAEGDTASSAPRRNGWAFAAGGIAAAAVVAALALVAGDSPEQDNPAANGRPGDSNSNVDGIDIPYEFPCTQATKVPMAALLQEARVAVTASTPEGADFTGAYFCLGSPDTPALTYGDVVVSYEAGWGDVDIEDKWNALIRDEDRGYVETFGNDLALVRPVGEQDKILPSVLIVRGDTLIRVQGKPGAPIEPLVDVASHLESAPENPTTH